MMYKLFNKLFGWHYVLLETGIQVRVVRVRVFGDVIFGKIYGDGFTIDRDGLIKGSPYVRGYKPLTWSEK